MIYTSLAACDLEQLVCVFCHVFNASRVAVLTYAKSSVSMSQRMCKLAHEIQKCMRRFVIFDFTRISKVPIGSKWVYLVARGFDSFQMVAIPLIPQLGFGRFFVRSLVYYGCSVCVASLRSL